MKKLLSHGLVVAALLGLSAPAMANDLYPYACCPKASAPVCGCGCPKVKPAITTQSVTIGQMCPCPRDITQGLPQLKVSQGAGLELHVLNPQPYSVRFNSQDLGISHLIPANSERVIRVDSAMTASLPANQRVAYTISSPNGCDNLAHSCFVVEPLASAVINTNRVSVYEEQINTPTYRTPTFRTPVIQKRSTVRGFW